MFTQEDGAIRGYYNTQWDAVVRSFFSTSADFAVHGEIHSTTPSYRLGISGNLPIEENRNSAISSKAGNAYGSAIASSAFNTKGLAIMGEVGTSPEFSFTATNVEHFSAGADYNDISTVLRILFNYDFATGEFAGTLQLEAPEEIVRYGRIEKILEARWVLTHRQALHLGKRYLRYLAKPRWSISFDTSSKEAACDVGDSIFVNYPICPVSGDMVVMKTDYNVNKLSARITAEYVSPSPTKIIISDVGNLNRTVSTPGSIVYANGVATITIVDVNDVPMTGATVTLDGRTSQISDKAGKVRFTTTKGKHILLVENDDYVPVEIGVEF